MDNIHGVKEPSGTSEATLTLPKIHSDGKSKVAHGDVPFAKGIKQKPTSQNQTKGNDKWKKDFFSSIQSIEESRASIVEKKNALKCYNLALKNMYYEKQLCKSQLLLKLFLHVRNTLELKYVFVTCECLNAFFYFLLVSFILVLDSDTINTVKRNISPLLLDFPQHSTEFIEIEQVESDTIEFEQ